MSLTFSSTKWARVLSIFCFAWICILLVLIAKINSALSPTSALHEKRYNEVLEKLRVAKWENEKLRENVVTQLKGHLRPQEVQQFMRNLNYSLSNPLPKKSTDDCECGAPDLEAETLRRRISDNIHEMWNYFRNEVKGLGKQLPDKNQNHINSILTLGADHKRSLLSDMERMRQSDGYELWRQREAKDLSDLVQRRLNFQQNPLNCFAARKLLCRLNKACGFGCQLHHVAYCLIVAYANRRTVILESNEWKYNSNGWEDVFQPISNSCRKKYEFTIDWPGQSNSGDLILPAIDYLKPRPSYLPLRIPEDVAPRLKRLHRNPIVWWIGQFLKYILRPQKDTRAMLKSSKEKLGWMKPIVGVHIRRTDKLYTESAYYSLEEYMVHVEDYFLTLELNGTMVPRQIYLATDDTRVIKEAQTKYPHYRILSRELLNVETTLNNIIVDLHMLSSTDYLVCTLSSQLCRAAYEIMQTMHVDASDRVKSLDDIYYFGGQHAHYMRAIIPHTARNESELNLQVNDLVQVGGNRWNGYSVGEHKRTKKKGLFPTFKVVDQIEEAVMATYTLF